MSEANHTPGPWRWELSERSKRIRLCGGKPKFDLCVMDFTRWGMGSARPRFLQPLSGNGMMILENAEIFSRIVPGREHHADWFKGIDHPDANLIAAAPDLLDALRGLAIDANRLCDRNLGGTYEDDCRRALETAWAAIANAEGRS